jgi:hypothetical protein
MIEMNGLQINGIAAIVATVANVIIGFMWYAKFFAKPWTKEMDYDPNMRPDGKTMAKGMFLMILGNFLFAWILAFYLAGWQFIPGAAEMGPVVMAVNSAISVWIGFLVPVHLSKVVWEKHSWKLFFINSGYSLVAAEVAAIILSY